MQDLPNDVFLVLASLLGPVHLATLRSCSHHLLALIADAHWKLAGAKVDLVRILRHIPTGIGAAFFKRIYAPKHAKKDKLALIETAKAKNRIGKLIWCMANYEWSMHTLEIIFTYACKEGAIDLVCAVENEIKTRRPVLHHDPSEGIRLACISNHLGLVMHLLPSSGYPFRYQYVKWCIDGDSLESAQYLMRDIVMPKFDTITEACKAGAIRIVRWLVSKYHISDLYLIDEMAGMAATHGHLDLLVWLDDKFKVLATGGRDLLRQACLCSKTTVIKWLVEERGFKITAYCLTFAHPQIQPMLKSYVEEEIKSRPQLEEDDP